MKIRTLVKSILFSLVLPVFILVVEPIFERYRDLADIFLREHPLITHDELRDPKTVREGNVYQKVEGRVFRGVNGVYSPL